MNTVELSLNFINDELLALQDNFKKLLHTNCRQLIDDKKLFRAYYLGLSETGYFYFRFKSTSSVPRINSTTQLVIFLTPEYRFKGAVDGISYSELLKKNVFVIEGTLRWLRSDGDFLLGGYSSTRTDDYRHSNLQTFENTFVYIGERNPLTEMLIKLHRYVELNKTNLLLSSCYDTSKGFLKISPLDEEQTVPNCILDNVAEDSPYIIQGPPGTGKSFLIANIANEIASNNKTVLITTLANKALIEIIKKSPLGIFLKSEAVFKYNLSPDELRALPGIQSLDSIKPSRGQIHFSTYYSASLSELLFSSELQKYDYVIVDEASQAYLPYLAATRSLGRKQIFIGDTNQLPPVVTLNKDILRLRKYNFIVEGLNAVSQIFPVHQLTQTYRLNSYAALCTGMFYLYKLKSMNRTNCQIHLSIFDSDYCLQSGNYLITIDSHKFNYSQELSKVVLQICSQLSDFRPQPDKRMKSRIALISHRVDDSSSLYRILKTGMKFSDDRFVVDTVHRCQGLTVDFALYVVFEDNHFSFTRNLFNVATSRASIATFIIAPKNLVKNSLTSYSEVGQFLKKLINDSHVFSN